MSLAQGNITPTRPRIEPGSPDPESDALTTRPVHSRITNDLAHDVGFLMIYLSQDILSQILYVAQSDVALHLQVH